MPVTWRTAEATGFDTAKFFSNAGEAFSQRVTRPFAKAGSFAAPSAVTAPSGEVQVASVPNDFPPGRLKRARNA